MSSLGPLLISIKGGLNIEILTHFVYKPPVLTTAKLASYKTVVMHWLISKSVSVIQVVKRSVQN